MTRSKYAIEKRTDQRDEGAGISDRRRCTHDEWGEVKGSRPPADEFFLREHRGHEVGNGSISDKIAAEITFFA